MRLRQQCSKLGLLHVAVAWGWKAAGVKRNLNQTGAIDAARRLASPEIGRSHEALRHGNPVRLVSIDDARCWTTTAPAGSISPYVAFLSSVVAVSATRAPRGRTDNGGALMSGRAKANVRSAATLWVAFGPLSARASRGTHPHIGPSLTAPRPSLPRSPRRPSPARHAALRSGAWLRARAHAGQEPVARRPAVSSPAQNARHPPGLSKAISARSARMAFRRGSNRFIRPSSCL
jgi:hypothetical protein